MPTYAYKDVLNRVQRLTPDEQLRLLVALAALVRQRVTFVEQPLHSFLELEGLGQEIWRGIDAQEYVNQERESRKNHVIRHSQGYGNNP